MTTARGRERYPICAATLERLAAALPQARAPAPATTAPMVRPSVPAPRAPGAPFQSATGAQPLARRKLDVSGEGDAQTEHAEPEAKQTEEMLGELVDMVLVGADEGRAHPEVHLVFKAEVLGGLQLRLVKKPDGMHATFVVEDAAARRAVHTHVDELIEHLRARGFAIAAHAIQIGDGR